MRPTDYNPNYFWNATVQVWFKSNSAKVVRPLRIPNVPNVMNIDILLVIKSKINAAFSIINE